MKYGTLGAAMVGIVTLAAQADDPVLILGDKPGDVQQVLASGGPPVLLADGRLLMLFSSGEKGQQKTLGRYSSWVREYYWLCVFLRGQGHIPKVGEL